MLSHIVANVLLAAEATNPNVGQVVQLCGTPPSSFGVEFDIPHASIRSLILKDRLLILQVFIIRTVLTGHGTPNDLLDLLVSYVHFIWVLKPRCSLSEDHLICLALIIVYHFISLQEDLLLQALWAFLVRVDAAFERSVLHIHGWLGWLLFVRA